MFNPFTRTSNCRTGYTNFTIIYVKIMVITRTRTITRGRTNAEVALESYHNLASRITIERVPISPSTRIVIRIASLVVKIGIIATIQLRRAVGVSIIKLYGNLSKCANGIKCQNRENNNKLFHISTLIKFNKMLDSEMEQMAYLPILTHARDDFTLPKADKAKAISFIFNVLLHITN